MTIITDSRKHQRSGGGQDQQVVEIHFPNGELDKLNVRERYTYTNRLHNKQGIMTVAFDTVHVFYNYIAFVNS
jgi:hypothetical protein